MMTGESLMNKPVTLNVRISGTLSDFVAANVGESGAYENVSEYVRDLIRRDKGRVEAEQFTRLKAELARAFSAPDASFFTLDPDSVIARNRRR
jgi:antitoxin ParD1/3/4